MTTEYGTINLWRKAKKTGAFYVLWNGQEQTPGTGDVHSKALFLSKNQILGKKEVNRKPTFGRQNPSTPLKSHKYWMF